MKKQFLFTALLACAGLFSMAQEVKVITIVESIVPGGIGRSRIIEHQESADAKLFTTSRTEGKDSDQKGVKRKDLKLDRFDETKLLNFYSLAGINFQNIASNDAIISGKLNDLLAQGWKIIFVTSGVESAGDKDPNGIFITRFILQK
ncbi:MAG: hypothetical protein ACI9YL_000392 [Luteibaculaceae bacterium]|jgi:hypothetical protein